MAHDAQPVSLRFPTVHFASGRQATPASSRTGSRLTDHRSATHAATGPWQWLETIALYGLLLIIAMRPLVSETYESALTPIDFATGVLGSTTPATTVMFNLGILLCSLASFLAAVMRRERWQWTRLEIGWLLMLAGAVVSTCAAANKRLAMNASADWLITTLIVFVLANLCRTRMRVALVLIVIAASGLASLARDTMQVVVELPETREHYLQNKTEFWSKQGEPLDSPRVALFERRMRGTAAAGFFPHSNVQAALLVLCGFAALALAGLSASRASGSHWLAGTSACFVGLGVTLLAGTLLTASKGGVLSALFGLAILAAAWWKADAIQRNGRTLVLAGWALAGLGVAGVLIYGAMRGGLPGSSLQFRWEYWKITRQIIADRPWTGAGALNFDRAYLLHKPIEYPEEIKDPHNFLLSMASQWGVLGAAGLMWMLLAGSYQVFRRLGVSPPDDLSACGRKPLLRWATALIAGYVILRLALLRDYWLSDDPGGEALALLDLELYGLVWAVAVGGLLWLVSRVGGRREATLEPGKNSGPLLRLALFCGAAAFLLHNLVEFAIFYPGTLTVFSALAGLLLSGPEQTEAGERAHSSVNGGLLCGGMIALLCFLWLVYLPVTQTSRLLAEGRAASSPDAAERALRDATVADPFDPTAPAELAGLYDQFGGTSHALETLEIALQRDPMAADLHKMAATAHERHYGQTKDPAELHAAVQSARMALSLYPASPDGHLYLARVLATAGEALKSSELSAEAVREYQRALDLDAARPGTDEVRRWSEQRRREIESLAKQAAHPQPATTTASGPAS